MRVIDIIFIINMIIIIFIFNFLILKIYTLYNYHIKSHNFILY